MNGGASTAAEEAEGGMDAALSLKGNIAVSVCMACLAAVATASELGPGLHACCASLLAGLLAGASSLGWGAYFSRAKLLMEGGDDD